MVRKAEISITFKGTSGDVRDKLAGRIVKKFKGEDIGGGTFLGPDPECDRQYEVPASKAAECLTALKKAGFKNAEVVERTPA